MVLSTPAASATTFSWVSIAPLGFPDKWVQWFTLKSLNIKRSAIHFSQNVFTPFPSQLLWIIGQEEHVFLTCFHHDTKTHFLKTVWQNISRDLIHFNGQFIRCRSPPKNKKQNNPPSKYNYVSNIQVGCRLRRSVHLENICCKLLISQDNKCLISW